MRNERARFLEGAKERGYAAETAEKLWEYIEPFAGYAFNKAHAFCYAFIAYQTAYLKANYPVEWMAAVLTTDVAKPEKIVSALGECRRSASRSWSRTSTTARCASPSSASSTTQSWIRQFDRGIRFGLAAIKNVGEGAVESVVAEREKNGPFKSLDDFCGRVDLRTVNKRVMEALVKCGAMDDFGPRERVLAGIDACMGSGQSGAEGGRAPARSTCSACSAAATRTRLAMIETPLPVVAEVGRREKLAWEKEAIGVFLSDHPFMDAARWFASSKYTVTSAISADIAEKQVTIAGIVAAVRRITTRKGDTMAVATLEDLYGSIEVVGFPRTYQEYAELWREDAILVVQGKVDARDDRLQIIAEGSRSRGARRECRDGADEEVVVFQPTVVVAPSTHRAWRPARSAEHGSNGNGNGNGSSHGHTNGNGNGSRPAAPEVVVRRLRVLVNRTDNEVADAKRLERLSHLLQDEGASPYEVIVAMPEGRFRVSAPDSRVRLTADLERQLRDDFGEESRSIRLSRRVRTERAAGRCRPCVDALPVARTPGSIIYAEHAEADDERAARADRRGRRGIDGHVDRPGLGAGRLRRVRLRQRPRPCRVADAARARDRAGAGRGRGHHRQRAEPGRGPPHGTTDLGEAVGEADYVAEAIVEDLAVKQALYAELDAITRPGRRAGQQHLDA